MALPPNWNVAELLADQKVSSDQATSTELTLLWQNF
jgi:hypothetical protein